MQEQPIQITHKNFTSRSAILTAKVCMYKRFLTYELNSTGYSTDKMSLDLLIGTVVHRGVQHLLDHCRIEHPTGEGLEESCIDAAVSLAYEVWRDSLTNHTLWLHSGEEDRTNWIIPEQECLFEGLIRAFALRTLPDLLEEYEVLEVEHEEVWEDFSPLVTFLGKADGLLKRRSDGAIVILSLKTASQYASVTTRDILHDMQGVSEWKLVQDRLNRWWEIIHNSNRVVDFASVDENEFALMKFLQEKQTPPEVFAVKYIFFLKGKRQQEPYGSGIYSQNSFLCHPYKMDSLPQIMSGGGIMQRPDNYKWKGGKGRQPKGWGKTDIWNDVGIKKWIEMLATGQVQAEEGDPFLTQVDEDGKIIGGILHTPDLIVRDKREIEEWEVSTRFQEENIANSLLAIKELEINHEKQIEGIDVNSLSIKEQNEIYEQYVLPIKHKIWQNFSKNTLSCHNFYGKDCQFVIHCHEMQSLDDLIASGYLVRRQSHHELERQALEPLMEKL